MAWWSLVLLACWLDWTSASGRVVVYTLGTDQDDVELLPGVVYHTQPLIQPYPTTQPKAESIIGEPDVPVEATTLTYGTSSNIRVAPSSPGKSYSWKEKGYTSCSASCLGGVQELIIQCVRDEDGKNASPYMCDPLTKPENRVRTCNDHPCPPRWNFTEFSQCTKSCDIGKQTRKISCIHEVTREDTITVPNSMCPQPPPPDRQYCTSSKCSKTCGGGIKQREIIDEFSAQPADFGAPLREDGVAGVLTLADPPDGCSALAPAPEGALWAVLIARYNCTFEVKIRNAQAAGFGLAIVHNVNSSDLEIMGTRDPGGVEIPSVFVSDIAGFALAGNYLHGTGYYVVAIGDGGDEPKSMNMKKKSLLLSGVAWKICRWESSCMDATPLLLLWIVVGVLSVFMIGILVMKFIRDKPSQRLLGKGAPCDEKLSSEDTLKGTPSSKEEEANSCISPAVA